MNRLIWLRYPSVPPFTQDWIIRKVIFALGVWIACCALSPSVYAVEPPPDGGYPNENTALGEDALFNLGPTSLGGNTAIGFETLYSTTSGSDNTAVGVNALHGNTTGESNTAVGMSALRANTTGSSNIAIGGFALVANTVGGGNTATGDETLEDNTTGFGNTANGITALTFNTTGSENTAIGDRALSFNTTGSFNTGLGYGALNQNTTGNQNIAIGTVAGAKLTTGSNNIDIGNQGKGGESRTIRIGQGKVHRDTYVAGINGVTVAAGVGVIVDKQGHLGTVTSSARFKDVIKPMGKESEAILALEPVTFHYKKELDPEAIPQFGLVAEEVAKVDPDLVARDESGKPYTVRYEAVNAMLLNEFLKEHHKVESLEAALAQQEKAIAALSAGLKNQAAQLRRVGAQLAANALRAQLVANKGD